MLKIIDFSYMMLNGCNCTFNPQKLRKRFFFFLNRDISSNIDDTGLHS